MIGGWAGLLTLFAFRRAIVHAAVIKHGWREWMTLVEMIGTCARNNWL
jgi:hypothetical protein